ncbi:hypothetical protein QFC21_001083 [Naganishia friedmannii]|uniref:Uncharacterized protein n=1 Tax=Naganishia friedmannii TaxID=89922 RepID=A0ACC2W850_9TREE|nr:hypothetical protein QFC21_001083 [Naganishia friedmannii]
MDEVPDTTLWSTSVDTTRNKEFEHDTSVNRGPSRITSGTPTHPHQEDVSNFDAEDEHGGNGDGENEDEDDDSDDNDGEDGSQYNGGTVIRILRNTDYWPATIADYEAQGTAANLLRDVLHRQNTNIEILQAILAAFPETARLEALNMGRKNAADKIEIMNQYLLDLGRPVQAVTEKSFKSSLSICESLASGIAHLERAAPAVADNIEPVSTPRRIRFVANKVSRTKARQYTHFVFARLVGRTHKPCKGRPGLRIGTEDPTILGYWPAPLANDNQAHLAGRISVNGRDQPITDPGWRPDWLNPSASSSTRFKEQVLSDMRQECTRRRDDNSLEVYPPEADLGYMAMSRNYRRQIDFGDTRAEADAQALVKALKTKQWFNRLQLGVFATRDEACEVTDIWWASDEAPDGVIVAGK